MTNPYAQKPASAFWRQSMSGRVPSEIDPVTSVPFKIDASDTIATAGSCFAQHISRTLVARGMRYLVTEKSPASAGAIDENYGVFPARFANIYTVRQLLQLFRRAYGIFEPAEHVWRDSKGRFLDPFRPRIQTDGFSSMAEMVADRDVHLAAVQTMFETCDVLIFTLGLTEGWVSKRDGAVWPVPPGVLTSDVPSSDYAFHNFSVAEMTADLLSFAEALRSVNPKVRLIFTVSPVALVATYEPRHVLVSNTYSKAALRVVADEVSRRVEGSAYFPSFEIITSAAAGNSFLEPDLREVRPEGVKYVMSIFEKHYLSDELTSKASLAGRLSRPTSHAGEVEERMRSAQRVICEEELLEPNDE